MLRPAVVWLVACAALCAALPDRVHLKDGTATFTFEHYLAIEDGRIYIKPNEETTGVRAAWALLQPGDGLPQTARAADNCARVGAISADDNGLVAMCEGTRLLYLLNFGRQLVPNLSADYPADKRAVALGDDGGNVTFKWTKHGWGRPFPALMRLPEGALWTFSQRGKTSGYFEDIDGNRHVGGVGCTTVYSVDASGAYICYVDGWIPPALCNFKTCTPHRGRFVPVAMAASGSTVFVMDAAGRMYTRLGDFDILGQDPVFIRYSYNRTGAPMPPSSKDIWILPPEDWREQPPIDGKITSLITILQNGEGNAARELRVQGVDSAGRSGYFSKGVYGTEWAFVPTDDEIKLPFVAQGESALGPSILRDYPVGPELSHIATSAPVRLSLLEFEPNCPPARVVFHMPSGDVEAALHFTDHIGTVELATMIVPLDMFDSSDPSVRAVATSLFGDASKRFVEFFVHITNEKNGAPSVSLTSARHMLHWVFRSQ